MRYCLKTKAGEKWVDTWLEVLDFHLPDVSSIRVYAGIIRVGNINPYALHIYKLTREEGQKP